VASARAGGGPVQAGQPYIVGEHRPELFVPAVNGTILPSIPPRPGYTPMSGGSGGTFHHTFSFVGTGSDLQRLAADAWMGLVRTGQIQVTTRAS
jgi:hypothetical protein